MRKIVFTFVCLLLVSCSVDVSDLKAIAGTGETSKTSNSLSYIRLSSSSASKDLCQTFVEAETDGLTWFYSAQKIDNLEDKTGETEMQEIKNLADAIGPFSHGSWIFTLYGYNQDTLSYRGKTFVHLDQEMLILQLSDFENSLQTSTLIIKSNIGFTSCGEWFKANRIKIRGENYNKIFPLEENDVVLTLPTGIYSVNVSLYKKETDITYAGKTIAATLKPGFTTVIGGSLSENLVYITFNAAEAPVD